MKEQSSIAPEAIEKLIPYQSARRIGGQGRLWLNANELESPIAYKHSGEYHRYPDFLPHDLATAYQDYAKTQIPTVAVRGADEAIDLLIRTFCQPTKDKILVCPPTYAMYQFCADAFYLDTIEVPLLNDFSLDIGSIEKNADKTKMVFLCNPNNPTGNSQTLEQIESVLKIVTSHTIVVVDEAYIEFSSQPSALNLIEKYPNLVVIRTLSKAFGLAATRVGFIMASSTILDYVSRLIAPYPISDCAASIALEALSQEGITLMEHSTQSLIRTKETFIDAIQSLECIESITPSHTNFVLIKTNADSSLFDYLQEHGVVTRNQNHEPLLRNCVRITIGSEQSMHEVSELIATFNTQFKHQG